MSYMRDICLMCVLYYLFTYFAGIAPCMGLRVSFVLFHLSRCYFDYVYVYVNTFDYLCNVLNKIVIKKKLLIKVSNLAHAQSQNRTMIDCARLCNFESLFT